MSNIKTCTHIKVSGVRCGSPALRGEQFCYFHQNAHRGVRRPKQSRLHPIALIEDETSIQYALMEVMNALMRNTIDLKRATLILRALHIAVKNASRVKFDILGFSSVKEIPDYADPPVSADLGEISETELPYSAFLSPQPEKEPAGQRRRAGRGHATGITTSSTAVPPHNFRNTPESIPHKPPTNAMPATQDRKSAARSTSTG